MITTLLWDVDDTLLDFGAAERNAVRTLFREFGFGPCTDGMLERYSQINRRYWERLERRELTRQEILVGRFREFFAEVGLDPDAAPAFNERYQPCLGETVVFRDNSYDVVSSLRGRVRQYVVSNGTVAAQTRKLRLSGLGELMDGVFLSERLGVEKPDIRFFDHVLAEIGAADRRQVMIVGDSLTSDMRGGAGAGIVTCWYNPERRPRPADPRIDHEIADLREVCGLL